MSKFVLTVIAALLWVALAACGSDDSDSGSGEPIQVGAISSLSGPGTFPDPTKAAKAVFDEVNEAGGIDGRQIEYTVEDDKADPQVAAQGARRLVDQEQVVANVGSASLVDCVVNARFFEQRDLLSLEAVPSDPVCNASSSFIPVVNGLFQSVGAQLNYAHTELGKDRLCVLVHDLPGAAPGYAAIIDSFVERTGVELAYDERKLGLTEDPTPYLTQVKAAKCEALVFSGTGPQVISIVKAAHQVGIGEETALLTLEPAYSEELGQALGKDGEGLYSHSDYVPWSKTDDPRLERWATLMDSAGVPQTFFAQAGYISAQVFVQALEDIDGEIDRESVTEAIGRVTSFRDEMMGSPLSFAPADAHVPEVLPLQEVQLRNGVWEPVTDEFIVIPAF